MSGWNGTAPAIARTGRSKLIPRGEMIGPVRVLDLAERDAYERYRAELARRRSLGGRRMRQASIAAGAFLLLALVSAVVGRFV